MRAKIPALQFPIIIYSIFANVAFTYGPIFQTEAQAESLITKLPTGFFSAFAIATGVSLFIIPVSSRTVVQKQQAGYIQLIRGTLKVGSSRRKCNKSCLMTFKQAQAAYLTILESSDMFSANEVTLDDEDDHKHKKKGKKSTSSAAETPEAKALNGAVTSLVGLHGKLYGDMPFGKREIAWGKLSAKDLDEIFKLFRSILVPLVGMSTITDIFERVAERRGWVKSKRKSFDRAEAWEHADGESKLEAKKVWNEVMKALHEPFAIAAAAMDEGLEHAGLVLEILPRPKKKKGEDEEAKRTDPRPGDGDFGKYLERKWPTSTKSEETHLKRGREKRA